MTYKIPCPIFYFPAIVGRPGIELSVEDGGPAVLAEVECAGGVPLSPGRVCRGHPLLLDRRLGGEVPRESVVTLLRHPAHSAGLKCNGILNEKNAQMLLIFQPSTILHSIPHLF